MAVAVTFVYFPRQEVNVPAPGTLLYGKMERPVIIDTVGRISVFGMTYQSSTFTLTLVVDTTTRRFKILGDCWDYDCLCGSKSD